MNDPEGLGAKDYFGPDIHVPDGDAEGGPVMLIDRSVSCRYLAAQCMVRRRKYVYPLVSILIQLPIGEVGTMGGRTRNAW